MPSVYENLLHSTNEGLKNVKDYEDLVAFKREAGLSTTEDVNKLTPLKRQLLRFATALERKGLSVQYNGVKPE